MAEDIALAPIAGVPRLSGGSGYSGRAVLAAVVGNAFQFYDFFLYATASALIFNVLFFPTGNPALGTMAAFASYAVGFVSRPFGSLVFGHIGDRFGRKVTLTWTLALMGLATVSIGLLPTYRQVGLLAPVLLTALRLLQGFATGGEWGGGMLMATENAPPSRRGLYGAFSQAGVGVGFIVSAGVFTLVRGLMPSEFMTWGWRIPFLVSVIVVAIGMIIRARVPESLEFRAAHAGDERPILHVLREHWRAMLAAGGLLIAEMSGPLLTTTFALAYGRARGLDGGVLLLGVILSMGVDTVSMLGFGRLSDSIGRPRIYMFGIIALAVCIYPFFLMIGGGSTALCLIAFVAINGVCHAAMIGVQPALLTELFPVEVRASGLALAQSLATLFVGFVPVIAAGLFYASGSILSVVAFTVGLCAVSLASVLAGMRMPRAQALR